MIALDTDAIIDIFKNKFIFSKCMLVYHATPKENLEGILVQGILPKADFHVFNGRSHHIKR